MNSAQTVVSYGKIGGASLPMKGVDTPFPHWLSKQIKTNHENPALAEQFCNKASAAMIKKGYVRVGAAKSKPGKAPVNAAMKKVTTSAKGTKAVIKTGLKGKSSTAIAKTTKAVTKTGLKGKSSAGKSAVAGKIICFITDDSAFSVGLRSRWKPVAISAGAQVSYSVKTADVLVMGDKKDWNFTPKELKGLENLERLHTAMKERGGEQIIQATDLGKEIWELGKFRVAVGLPPAPV